MNHGVAVGGCVISYKTLRLLSISMVAIGHNRSHAIHKETMEPPQGKKPLWLLEFHCYYSSDIPVLLIDTFLLLFNIPPVSNVFIFEIEITSI